MYKLSWTFKLLFLPDKGNSPFYAVTQTVVLFNFFIVEKTLDNASKSVLSETFGVTNDNPLKSLKFRESAKLLENS